ncbi:MAG: LPS export ABC transporter periplasmic protein LptC [Candidatus Omnitrophica bacterium]|nr:LPS export ABC transporter periplasmic protein LptC [Candidatus Omnitrophota bacterium]
MMPKSLVLVFIFLFSTGTFCRAQNPGPQETSDQQISDFSLTGFGERGKKTWDLAGKSADIFDNVVKLKDIIGNMYGTDEDIKLTADKGDFDKREGKVHLQENVIITTSSGAKLTTDSLDWDRKNNVVKTEDQVNIERQNMTTQAKGAIGHTNLKQVQLQKDVTVNITQEQKDKTAQDKPANAGRIVITCDGPLDIDYEKNIATFRNNVKVDREDSQIYSDIMYVYFVTKNDNKNQGEQDDKNAGLNTSSIDKIVSQGNVKIVRGENTSYCDEAVYTAADKKITLLGRPKLIIYSSEDMNASFGN